MDYVRMKAENAPEYPAVWALYRRSFPIFEQRRDAAQKDALTDEAYHMVCLKDKAFAGLVMYWETDAFLYVEHLAIAESMRGTGLGRQVLDELKKKNKPVILEIDPPVDEVSCRRRHFYERAGFAENPYPHVHPPYRREFHGHSLVVMSSPAIDACLYDSFYRYLEKHVMQFSDQAGGNAE